MSTFNHMVRGFRLGALLCGGLSVAALGGCGAAQPEGAAIEAEAPPVSNLLASLRLADGTQVDFHEPQAGHVIIIASADLPQLAGKISPVALYEDLAGRPAPAALIEAEGRSVVARVAKEAGAAARVTEPTADGRRALPAGTVGAVVQGLSAADFQASYCPGGTYNFYYCWTNRTGNGSIEIKSVDWLRTYVNAYNGQVLLSLSYKNLWGNWISLSSLSVPQDTVKTIYTSSNDTYLVEVTQASGDGYHWSTYGDK